MALVAVIRRTPWIVSNPQFWAEDGPLFFLDAYQHPLRSILQPYADAGYYLLAPRLIAAAATAAPVKDQPGIYVWVAAAIVLAVCALALSSRINLGRGTRCVMALAVALAPGPHEVFSSLTNSQWMFALGLVLVAASSAARAAGDRIRDVAIVLLAGLTGPFSLFFVPLFALRALRERSRFSLLLFGLVTISGGIQALHLPGSRIGGEAHWREMVGAFALHGSRLFTSLFGQPSSWVVALFVALATAGVYAALVFIGLWRPAPEGLTFTLAALLVLAPSFWAFRGAPLAMAGTGRYLYVPAVTLTWAIAALLPSRLSIAGLVLIATSAIPWFVRPWRLVDFHWKEASSCIGVTDPCVIPINPSGWNIVVHPKPSR
jgi:hypothetical protein